MNSVDGIKPNLISSVIKFALLVAFVTLVFLYYYANCHSRMFLTVFGALMLGVLILIALVLLKRVTLESTKAFAAVLAVSGAFFIFAFTPGSVPDETFHYWSSYYYSNIILGGDIDYEDAMLEMRQSDASLCITNELSADMYSKTLSTLGEASDCSQSAMVHVSEGSLSPYQNPFYIKLPSVLGICLGRLLGLDGAVTFYLGRIFNFILFAVLAIAAVKLVPVGKTGLKLICLLPMTLHVCASYSYDAGTIGLSFLAIALLLKLWDREKQASNQLLLLIVILEALLVPCKLVYCASLLLGLFAPRRCFVSNKQMVLFKCGLCIGVLLCFALTKLTSVTAMATGPTSGLDQRGDEFGHFYTIESALADPAATLGFFLGSMLLTGDFYAQTLVGGSLGWFQGTIAAPYYVVFAYYAILFLSFIKCDNEEDYCIDGSLRMVCLIASLLAWIAVMASMYLGWTFDTEPVILGIQGRYFLPVLPLFMLACRFSSLSFKVDSANLVIGAVIVLNYLYMMRTVSIVLQ